MSWVPALEKILSTTLKIHEDISVAFVSARTMQALNARYRGKKYPTDVLSFSLSARENKIQKPGEPLFGEIIFYMPAVRRRANLEHTAIGQVFQELLIHAVVHLMGYDHERNHDARVMENKEKQLVVSLTKNLGRKHAV